MPRIRFGPSKYALGVWVYRDWPGAAAPGPSGKPGLSRPTPDRFQGAVLTRVGRVWLA